MTKEEHELMAMMFARVYEHIAIITETLKSKAVWTEDDERAFSHLAHNDPETLLKHRLRAAQDYLNCAAAAGVPMPEGFLKV